MYFRGRFSNALCLILGSFLDHFWVLFRILLDHWTEISIIRQSSPLCVLLVFVESHAVFLRIFVFFSTPVFWLVFRLSFSLILVSFWDRLWDQTCGKNAVEACFNKKYPHRRKLGTMTRPVGSLTAPLACAAFWARNNNLSKKQQQLLVLLLEFSCCSKLLLEVSYLFKF